MGKRGPERHETLRLLLFPNDPRLWGTSVISLKLERGGEGPWK
jgi:hypothetical protein